MSIRRNFHFLTMQHDDFILESINKERTQLILYRNLVLLTVNEKSLD